VEFKFPNIIDKTEGKLHDTVQFAKSRGLWEGQFRSLRSRLSYLATYANRRGCTEDRHIQGKGTRCILYRDIYVAAGVGGVGSTGSGVAGGNGQRSWVCVQPNSTNAADVILVSGAAAAVGGPAGTASAAAGGAAETIATNLLSAWTGLGSWTAIAGQIGGASSITANSAAVVWGGSGVPWCGGTGGAGATAANAVFNGGQITGAGLIPTIAGGTGVAGGPGNPGNPGLSWQRGSPFAPQAHTFPWAGMGGTGGGSSATAGSGGAGGQATGFGSGGGGGGAGVTGAAGGRGAPGFVLIMWV
jgi:hypothetical protein